MGNDEMILRSEVVTVGSELHLTIVVYFAENDVIPRTRAATVEYGPQGIATLSLGKDHAIQFESNQHDLRMRLHHIGRETVLLRIEQVGQEPSLIPCEFK
jgi:hypothetical protein